MRKAKVVWHKDDDAVSPVIGTILMVAITVVLAAVLWLMVSGMLTTGDETKTTVNMSSPSVTFVDPTWDALMDVNKITPKDDKVAWNDVRVIIKRDDGTVGLPESTLVATATSGLEVLYIETSTGDTKMSAGDSIKIVGMDDTFEGATMILKMNGEKISTVELPTDFV